MNRIKKEAIKSIVLGILVILSIYLYYRVYFNYDLDDFAKALDVRENRLSEDELLEIVHIILATPKDMYLNISKNVVIGVLSTQKEYFDVVSKFVSNLKENIVKKNYSLKFKKMKIDEFKSSKSIFFNYGYFIDFHMFVYELSRRNILPSKKTFEFDKVFIKESNSSTEVYFFNSNTEEAAILTCPKYGFSQFENRIEQSSYLVFSWSDGLGFTELVSKDSLIPVEFSNIQFSEVKIKESDYKKELIIRRLFPDTILTKRNVLKSGEIVITDERREFVIKSDGSYIFRFTKDIFCDKIESITEALMNYMKNFYTNEDIRVYKIENSKNTTKIYLITRVDGIDLMPSDNEYCSYIEISNGRLKKISGHLFDAMSVRTAKIKVSGIAAIDTIKERKGDIFIRNISLRYIATGNTSYPYWQIDTDNGTVYVETIK
ncbi:hypothetical protein Csac_2556 [Caldicellulosiruptor saccharolyticus DSM 8903]|uniref:Regulatory protein YycH domain-containing protein n=1 Tax=Caldicellulosiruptor saccharolyticus (strain ATCC 43494 / DSM 8903 / Tp8T 6331) TaxID=351627 RepID=A4XMJ4_CALS8|nr:hypothetical protein [Caldicellulosiruptor saccharolyticus]ABP68129.1 hypothetical protein Csac_2556 [Caldicellulosiruptor saccharolyticus DSM 8903]